jgi:Rod binding domain-containing protein
MSIPLTSALMAPPLGGPQISNPDQVLRKASSAARENAKIEKSAKDFESILLGTWLQKAEESFGSVPGEDGQDSDPGKEQFQGLAMQQLGSAMTAGGGIGIARMISTQLHKADEVAAASAAKSPPA